MAVSSPSMYRNVSACFGLAFSLALVLAAHAAFAAQPQSTASSAQNHRQPVLVELFTSEGCSDCPPADTLLAELDEQQFIPGAEAIVLSEHVTYWNHLGWSDPFSFAAIDDRQQEYERNLGGGEAYTPQMIVDGTEQFEGSDLNKLRIAVQREAAKPKVDVQIEDVRLMEDGEVTFTVHLPAGAKGTLLAAVAENATVSEVTRGENKGRTLHHVAVVRVLKELASSAAHGRPQELKSADVASAEKEGASLRLVVFLTKGADGQVVGAAEQMLSATEPPPVALTSK